MAFKKKLILLSICLFLLTITSILMMSECEVASHELKGRVVKIEKRFLINGWRLLLFSDGRVYEIGIDNDEDVIAIKNYKKKYIIIEYSEYLTGGILKEKYRFNRLSELSGANGIDAQKVIESIDHNLTCVLASELKNNKALNEKVHSYLNKKGINMNKIIKECNL